MNRFRSTLEEYLHDIIYQQIATNVLLNGQTMEEKFHGFNMSNSVNRLIDDFKKKFPEYNGDLHFSLQEIINQVVFRIILQNNGCSDCETEMEFSLTGFPDEENFKPLLDIMTD